MALYALNSTRNEQIQEFSTEHFATSMKMLTVYFNRLFLITNFFLYK